MTIDNITLKHLNDLSRINIETTSFHTNGLVKSTELPEILFVTSFPERECGIATYSADLIAILTEKFPRSFKWSVCALESNLEHPVYQTEPKYILNTESTESYLEVADKISQNKNLSLIVIQHEFGFFAKNEANFLRFLKQINQPILVVFHTVLAKPNDKIKSLVNNISNEVNFICVMTKNAQKILQKEYKIPNHKLTIIPHGTHLIDFQSKESLKTKYLLENRIILSTFGLLSSCKDIEVTLNALPKIIEENPTVLFLILGKTHPIVKKNEGEIYREKLESIVESLHLQEHVTFVNEYLPLPKLLEYLQLTDVYLFTSKDPNQAVSGTFSYALSVGCPIVSTPIPHALEVLKDEAGIFFDFGNSDQMTKKVNSLLKDKKQLLLLHLKGLTKMAPTAWENVAILHMQLFHKITNKPHVLNYQLPKINLNHIEKMTTDFGFIQFSKISQPDYKSGYTLDDNARAMIALCQQINLFGKKEDIPKIKLHLDFIEFCLQENGRFLNYVDTEKEFTKQNYCENLEDSNGRAIWSLGMLISLKEKVPASIIKQAKSILSKVLPEIHTINSTRSMAFILKGLCLQNDSKHTELIQIFADRLVQMYLHENRSHWCWFETYLTYGNSVIPEALLCAYQQTGNKVYKSISKESFDFLLDKLFNNHQISVISNNGWLNKTKQKIKQKKGGEQAIDVAYTIIALDRFYTVFKLESYKTKMIEAFNWFLGENQLHQIVYNPKTGGCYDGLEKSDVNLNQGAESTISYLMARLIIEKYEKFPILPLNDVSLNGSHKHISLIES
jgi:glycosyltransferase involved in cell wall biosynthesis